MKGKNIIIIVLSVVLVALIGTAFIVTKGEEMTNLQHNISLYMNYDQQH